MEDLLFERSHGRRQCVYTDKSSILHTRIVTNITFADGQGWNSGAIDGRVRSKKKKGQSLRPVPVSCHFASSLSGLESCNSNFCIHIIEELIFYNNLILREPGRCWLLGMMKDFIVVVIHAFSCKNHARHTLEIFFRWMLWLSVVEGVFIFVSESTGIKYQMY